MIAGEIFGIAGDDLLVVASLGAILIAFAIWRIFYVEGRRQAEADLTDGSVLVLSDGVVREASGGAIALLGRCIDRPMVDVLGEFLGEDAIAAREAVDRLERTGDPVDMLVRRPDGQPYELIGAPAGALIRLVLREARLLDDRLRLAQEHMTAAADALQNHEWAQETMRGLIAEAPIIAWHRTAEGTVNWSDGEIRTRSGSVVAEQAVDLIVARTKLNRQPVLAGQPQKSRIEIVVNDGAETVSLHVIEIVRHDGARIGIATDAGTAASAERTLTRFVQTMTETFAHLTVGLAIFDRNQTLALFNPALVQMWQVEPAWLARRPSLRDIIDELRATRRLPELQDFHKWRSRLMNLFENTEAADYEELWHLADGSNIRVLARPHPHGSLAFIFDDVTERMRLEQRYRHSIDLRRATLDGLNEGIAVFGANGLLQFVNQSFHQIWGTDGESVYAAMHARQLVGLCEELTLEDEVWHRLHSFITGEENRRAWTTRLTMRSGRILTARFAPLPDGSTMAVFSDITDSERIATALRQRSESMELMNVCAAAVSERSANLLHPALTALGERVRSSEAISANTLMEQIDGMLVAVDDISDLSTAPHARSDDPTRCDVTEVIGYCARLLSHRAMAGGVTLEVIDDGTDRLVRFDTALLTQIAFRLLDGVVGKSVPGTTISLWHEVAPGHLAVNVRVRSSGATVIDGGGGDGTVMIAPRVDALMARADAVVDIDDARPNDIHIACHLPIPEADPGPRYVAEDAAGQDGNVHPLNPKAVS